MARHRSTPEPAPDRAAYGGFLGQLPWVLAAAGLTVLAGFFVYALTLTGGKAQAFQPFPPTANPTEYDVQLTVYPAEPIGTPPPGFVPGASVPPGTLPPGTLPTAAAPDNGIDGSEGRFTPAAPGNPGPAPTTTRPQTVTAPPSTVVTTAPAGQALAAKYRLMSTYTDSFIGEVLVTNNSDQAVGWSVRLRFGTDVGMLHTYWVESAPQATLKAAASEYVFTSTVDVGPRSTVPLRFHFERKGTAITPVTCSANAVSCS